MPGERIVVDAKVHFGQPCVRGTRVPVYCLLELVQDGIPSQEIVKRYYLDLTTEDVKACVESATALMKARPVPLMDVKTDPGEGGLVRGEDP
jgi:uncharacterized protein (DUF433 family)